jgi:K+-transporting ATPase ATPase C chain
MINNKKETKHNYKPVIGIALASLLACGLLYPLLITGLAQVLFPYQANGEIVVHNGQQVGSYLISQNFTLPQFFHPRPGNDSASGVDPDITIQDAYSQIPRIQQALNSTNISNETLRQLVDENAEGTYWIFGSPYVNVLRLNLALINQYPDEYLAK